MTENPYQSPAYFSYPHKTDVRFGNPVTARGQLTPRDMGQLTRLISAPISREAVSWCLFMGAMIVAFFCLIKGAPPRSTPQVTMSKTEMTKGLLLTGAAIGLSVVTVVGFWYMVQSRNRRICSAKQGVFAEQTVRVSAEGLEFAFGGIRSVIPWTAVLWSRHNKTMLTFQTNGPVVWWALPRRWFDKDEHWDRVVEFFEYRLVASRDSDRITQIACEG